MASRRITRSLIVSLVLAGAAHAQSTWFVDASAAAGGDGASWASAFTTLDDALEIAARFDEIWVADGVYKPALPPSGDPRTAEFFVPRDLKLFGGFAGGEPSVDQRAGLFDQTVLSGDIGLPGVATDNCYHVVETWGTVTIDGFRITGGHALGSATPNGAGILLSVGQISFDPDLYQGSGLRLRHSRVDHHTSARGGAIYGQLAAVHFADCRFEDNEATGIGGAVSLQASQARIDLCEFLNNRSGSHGGAFHGASMAVDSTGRPFVGFVGCLFRENRAAGNGGALYLGGSAFSSGKAFLSNCTIALNVASAGGGGIFAQSSSQVPAVCWLENSIVYYNRGPSNQDIFGTLTCWNSIAPGQTGTGVTNVNPKFINVRAKDLRLRPDSSAVDAGDFTRLPFDTTDVDDDGLVTERIPIDLDGTTRVLGGGLDLGAYERP